MIRDYICPSCFLVYPGYFDSQRGREPCPHCGETHVHASDTTSCAYFELNLAHWFGADVCEKNYWTLADRPLDRTNDSRGKRPWDERHEPNPERPDYWAKTREKAEAWAAKVGGGMED